MRRWDFFSVLLKVFSLGDSNLLLVLVLWCVLSARRSLIMYFLFQGGSPLAPPFVARFGFLPYLTLRSNGRLSVRRQVGDPCTHGASNGIPALESVATCQPCQPKQMRRNSYLRQSRQWLSINSLLKGVTEIDRRNVYQEGKSHGRFTAFQTTTRSNLRFTGWSSRDA